MGALLAHIAITGSPWSSDKALHRMSTQDEQKRRVGYKAIDDFVTSNMYVGLGTGSTAYFAVERLGQKLVSGELTNVIAVPTSKATKAQAESLNIPLVELGADCPRIDVAIDGADTTDSSMTPVKGGGGALLREKMVENFASKFVVIVDASKIKDHAVGPAFPVPVEITPFCHTFTASLLQALPQAAAAGCTAVLRMGSVANNKLDGEELAVTDNQNYIVDLHLQRPVLDVAQFTKEISSVVGVVEHGVFESQADVILYPEGDKVLSILRDSQEAASL